MTILWKQGDGKPVSCTEKIKVLNQNYAEIQSLLQDAMDDAVLMGCSAEQFKSIYAHMLAELASGYTEQGSGESE